MEEGERERERNERPGERNKRTKTEAEGRYPKVWECAKCRRGKGHIAGIKGALSRVYERSKTKGRASGEGRQETRNPGGEA